MSYDNTNRISIWKNDKMREGKNDAPYTGTYVDGQGNEHFVNLWPKKEGQSDKAPVLSGSVKPKQQQSGGFPSQGGNANKGNDPFASSPDFGDMPEEDLPF